MWIAGGEGLDDRRDVEEGPALLRQRTEVVALR